MKKHQLYAKFTKCEFWLNHVAFLGHVISKDGVMVDLAKIATVKEWARPRNTIDIHSFLELTGYYKKFMKGFSKIALLLTILTQKENKFEWNKECKKSF